MVELLLNARWQAGLSAARTAVSVRLMVSYFLMIASHAVVVMEYFHL